MVQILNNNNNNIRFLYTIFCSKDCSNIVQSRSGKTLRMAVFERDRGVCEKCHLIVMHCRIKCWATPALTNHRKFSATIYTQKDKLARDAYEGSAWEADHIIAVKDGGGECTVDNMRTLCGRCHARNTKSNINDGRGKTKRRRIRINERCWRY